MSRTNIDLDDQLVADAMKATGARSKRAVVEEGLRQILKRQELRKALLSVEGRGWEGDLDKMRRSWSHNDK